MTVCDARCLRGWAGDEDAAEEEWTATETGRAAAAAAAIVGMARVACVDCDDTIVLLVGREKGQQPTTKSQAVGTKSASTHDRPLAFSSLRHRPLRVSSFTSNTLRAACSM